MKKISARRDPRFNNKNTLNFDNFTINALSNAEKSKYFISKYNEKVNPIEKYCDYFNSSAYSISHIMKIIKTAYERLVLEKDWTEVKFVTVTNEIFENDYTMSPGSYKIFSKKYDDGTLDSQNRRRI